MLTWVTAAGVDRYDDGDQIPPELGPKARGLLDLPTAWTLPFVAVSPDVCEAIVLEPNEGRAALANWVGHIEDALSGLGIDSNGDLIVRSNAIGETLVDRGKYTSQRTSPALLRQTIQDLLTGLLRERPQSRIGLIVQAYVQPIERGHLSNERRVAKDKRDAQLEVEQVSTGEIREERIAFRGWRRSTPVRTEPLLAVERSDVPRLLREPLAWAVRSSKRIHFEWVWNGQRVYIVQADVAPDKGGGVAPTEVVATHVPSLDRMELRRFRVATEVDISASPKLGNHFIYMSNGYWQPTFYILDDRESINGLLRGRVDREVACDLELLTTAALIIRTSYSGERLPLLPRSGLLTSGHAAIEWLTGHFSKKVDGLDLSPDKVMLVAHHYIPAAASAFSMATPANQEVLIEALWGIPEGLYFFPCDVYVVHTRVANGCALREVDFKRFKLVSQVHWKPNFVAPDKEGRFRRYETAAPWDWRRTVSSRNTLYEITRFTRQLAAAEGRAINLMWFLDCETPLGTLPAIPWYHEPLEDRPPSPNFQRNAQDDVKKIATEQDLKRLEGQAQSDAKGGKRIVVELWPAEDIAIRDDDFARRVGKAANELHATVLLNGASLSHIYYVLRRTGANVVTRNLADTRIREVHAKLVRDRIPEAVASSGEVARVAPLSPSDKLKALKMKLVEEAFEVRDATGDSEIVEELADVLEVYMAILDALRVSPAIVEEARKSKAAKRGGFDAGILLIETESGGDPLRAAADAGKVLEYPAEQVPNVVVSDSAPELEEVVRPGWRDKRSGEGYTEFLQRAAITLTHPQWKIESPKNSIYVTEEENMVVDWQLTGQRRGGTLNVKLRVRVGTSQMKLPLVPPRKDE